MSQKIRQEKFQAILSLYVLNCFKYLGQNILKIQTRKILNYIKSLCAKFLKIFSNIYFGTKFFKNIRQEKS